MAVKRRCASSLPASTGVTAVCTPKSPMCPQLSGSPGASASDGSFPGRAEAAKSWSGRKDRTARSPERPPTTSTHSSPVTVLATWATKVHDAPRMRVPCTCTGSPGCRPAQCTLRFRSASALTLRSQGTKAMNDGNDDHDDDDDRHGDAGIRESLDDLVP